MPQFKPKILIVDDETFLGSLVSDVLTSEEITTEDKIEIVKDGKLGLQAYKDFQPEIIISDMMMPEMNGAEMIREIRKFDDDIEIIVMTGFADLDMAIEVIKLKIFDLLRKPFQPEELTMVVKKLIDRILLVKENEMMKQKLINSEKLSSVGLLSAGIAHEINNANTFVKGNLELVQKYISILSPEIKRKANEEGPDQKKFQMVLDTHQKTIDSAINGSERIRKIVSGLLSFSREASQGATKSSIKTILDEAITLTQHKTKKYKVDVNLPENLHQIRVNEQELIQVFMNLLVNASDAIAETQKENGTIRISVKEVDQKQIIEVIDNGKGMNQKTVSKIFDPFFTTKPQGKGTGLGMSVSKGYIENNNGEIFCESVENEGTTFRLAFNYQE